ncbi:KpsF/GutQ family sugar-phosphate isomerase [Cellvibrio japonicus]|uniref:Arabinose 5-phosphate isomerase n=1 Tax=Cellvibrio japonicus (strain Ueda107) TaxID=498211 RepID=B3PBY9_CELJU|nr:KpsF/GutQ family sugar-phosphate isomerase [Cellvibrio japonicus]ACE86133.1 sugar isomerase, KpsF/GutQ family subfamily [Cellvibrio japonicus Ueda107]QEI13145.1 KpsF/GutQ family sugar-phosphate isomerase [Cellvibrio japonicus]QEI16719.1 KpsF/GutQ family sugar-phosphate isomerase [Cellvibrio japonicus]QEI20297.1 KpsF/GutQ family sugar-phosphate isomerase [Cellvibrio japonicus]
MNSFDYVQSARRTIRLETEAIAALEERIGEDFRRACDLILAGKGRVIVTGMGKSGHIGKKIAATLASTGTPAFFVHPGEASHGDLGMITKDDIVLAISYSGTSNEIVTLLPLLKRTGINIISMTGNPQSILAEVAEVHLNIYVATEACPLDLAPTSSTSATLVLGDALAIALLEARGFTAEDFAFSHPGGALGRKLLLRLSDIMHTGDEIPRVSSDTPLLEALMVISAKGFGMTTVTDATGQFLGIYTDGDLRRSIDRGVDIHSAKVGDLMNPNPKILRDSTLAAEALKLMEESKINVLLVSNAENHLIGIVKINDILRAGII